MPEHQIYCQYSSSQEPKISKYTTLKHPTLQTNTNRQSTMTRDQLTRSKHMKGNIRKILQSLLNHTKRLAHLNLRPPPHIPCRSLLLPRLQEPINPPHKIIKYILLHNTTDSVHFLRLMSRGMVPSLCQSRGRFGRRHRSIETPAQ